MLTAKNLSVVCQMRKKSTIIIVIHFHPYFDREMLVPMELMVCQEVLDPLENEGLKVSRYGTIIVIRIQSRV